MKQLPVKSLRRAFACLFVLTLTVSGVGAVNTTAETFILSNEAPGNLVTMLVNAGYSNLNLYEVLQQLVEDSNPSFAGIITPQFLKALHDCPASSEIFTTLLKKTPADSSLAISTDGTVQTTSVYAYNYYNQPGTSTLLSNISGVGNAYCVHTNDSTTPLTSWTVTGTVTTTYKVFAIGSGSVTNPASVLMPFKPAVSLQPNRNALIGFFLPNSQPVTVNVYNASGAEIASLVNENLGSGTHSINWNTRNLAAGWYAVRMQTGSGSFVRSVSIVR